MTEPWPLRATPLADQIFDIAREIRGPNDEGRLMFNTLYDIGEQVAALTAERTQLRAESDSLRALVERVIEIGPNLRIDTFVQGNWTIQHLKLVELLKDCQRTK